jgi:hypothetical protein
MEVGQGPNWGCSAEEKQITPCSPLKFNRRFGGTYPSILTWICRRHVPPKRRLTFDGLRGVMSQTTETFVTISVRTSDPTQAAMFVPFFFALSRCRDKKNGSRQCATGYEWLNRPSMYGAAPCGLRRLSSCGLGLVTLGHSLRGDPAPVCNECGASPYSHKFSSNSQVMTHSGELQNIIGDDRHNVSNVMAFLYGVGVDRSI